MQSRAKSIQAAASLKAVPLQDLGENPGTKDEEQQPDTEP